VEQRNMVENKKVKKKEKYNRKKVEADGYKFDSIAERDYYYKLKNEKLTGKIIDFEMQVKFILQESFMHEVYGHIRAIICKLDFRVIPITEEEYMVDVKGMATADAKNKRKMFLKKFPQDLRWVAKSKKHGENGWICYFELEKIRRENRKKKELLKIKDGE
jgi:hypothetical protein